MIIGKREFDTDHRCYLMGILNVTPDSFSDGGRWQGVDAALARTEVMLREGADLIDVGGESTRPGYTRITEEEEIERTCPVIEAITARFDVPVSIDTYKSGVADAALEAGAVLVNDIWGFKADPEIAKVTAKHQACCVLMHNRDTTVYQDFLGDVLSDLKESVAIAEAAGVPRNRIILDPGVGFGKDVDQNLTIIQHLDRLQELGLPVLLGTSNKSVIGKTLDLPVEERLEGTLATTVIGMLRGCAFVRVHDVKANRRAMDMTAAILKK